MKDFDEERDIRAQRDRSFKLAGQTFICRIAVAPEKVLPWAKMVSGETDLTEEETITVYDDTVVAFLEPGQEDKWHQVRDPELDNPLNIDDLTKLVRWLFEEQTGRPTSQPSASSSGSGNGKTETSSTASSASTEAVGSTT